MRRRQRTAPRLRQIVASRMLPSRLRVRIYRLIGIPIGQGSGVMSDVFIDGNGLYIGDRCFINRFCPRLDANAPIIIEDGVYLAFGVTVLTSSHEHGTAMREQRAHHVGACDHRPRFVDRNQRHDPARRDDRRRLRHRCGLRRHR